MSGFEPHRRPNESKLEVYRDEVTEMRGQNWPLRKIAEWLRIEKQIEVSYEAVRNFCAVRGITKGKPVAKVALKDSSTDVSASPSGEPASPSSTRQAQLDRLAAAKKRAAKKPAKKKFVHDGSKPLKIDRD